MAKELLKRSEVKEEYTWNLKDMYASDEDWKKDLDEIDKILDEIGKMEGKVAACAQNLLFVLECAAKAEEKLDYDFNYAERLFDEENVFYADEGVKPDCIYRSGDPCNG